MHKGEDGPARRPDPKAAGMHKGSYDHRGRLKDTPANRALRPDVASDEVFSRLFDLDCCRWHDDSTVILCGDADTVLRDMRSTGIEADCAVTSPPYYGMRDYGMEGEIGLEDDPHEFIDGLRDVFHDLRDVLSPTGSLWVNMGDTYWSGKGKSTGREPKQSARRFGTRPQDRHGDGHWTRPKQLLLIPHRMAIALQDDGWLVRNDDIWVKPNPVPDPVRDRCSVSHEHVFHFTRSRYYYFNSAKVSTECPSGRTVPPRDTWVIPTVPGHGAHRASYPMELLRIPVDSTTPDGGVVLDPFMGSGTTLAYAKAHGLRSVGIELNPEYCDMAVDRILSM